MTTVTLKDAQSRLAELIDHTPPGEAVVITRDERPVAQLVPLPRTAPQPVFGACKGMLIIADLLRPAEVPRIASSCGRDRSGIVKWLRQPHDPRNPRAEIGGPGHPHGIPSAVLSSRPLT